ncbi:MAG: AAA ATPase [uncultured Rubrobacteraceae bacterium]|uniref:AAA ATPase n=1 Tax=uncultured Rubrobacteraceae bacterium TaxID=349277 RepID=A0A6J4PY78_9ACTN|nr:MAG: AAA ATPase [uncultured Rubrobacteraceae bacterium]
MDERGLVGLEARTPGGEEIGRISEVVEDEDGAVTHVVVEQEGQRLEVPITAISLDREVDFATFHADRSDDEPGDHVGDEEAPQGYAPSESDVDDSGHEGQFVTAPTDPNEAASLDQQVSTEADEAGGWQDEDSTTVDSGYPRTDAYIDPDTGEEEVDPALNEGVGVGDEVARLIDGTGLRVRSVKDGVVELTGAAASEEDLIGSVDEIASLTEVREVDTTDVDVG